MIESKYVSRSAAGTFRLGVDVAENADGDLKIEIVAASTDEPDPFGQVPCESIRLIIPKGEARQIAAFIAAATEGDR